MIYGLISFLTASFAFGYGAIRLFKKRKPMYLQLLVCASGCFALEQLSYIVNLWCGVTAVVSIGMFGIFGCNFFLLSANFGTLDKIVDESKGFDMTFIQCELTLQADKMQLLDKKALQNNS